LIIDSSYWIIDFPTWIENPISGFALLHFLIINIIALFYFALGLWFGLLLFLHIVHILLHLAQFVLRHTGNLEYGQYKPQYEPADENEYNCDKNYPDNHIPKGMQTVLTCSVNKNIITMEIYKTVATNQKIPYFCTGNS